MVCVKGGREEGSHYEKYVRMYICVHVCANFHSEVELMAANTDKIQAYL